MRWLEGVPEDPSSADFVVFVDACSSLSTVGVFIPTVGYLSWTWNISGVPVPHINGLELLGCLLGALAVVSHVSKPTADGVARPQDCRVHIWTDNTPALSFVSRRRSSSPLTAFLTILLVFLQVKSKTYVTFGHVSGTSNLVADTLSRRFQVPEAQQQATWERLLDISQLQFPEALQLAMQSAAVNSSGRASELAQLALTCLGSVSFGRS